MTGPCALHPRCIVGRRHQDKFSHFHPPLSYAKIASMANHTFIARLHKTEVVEGIKEVSLTLIRDHEYVELEEGDEFVTVTLQIDPFK